MNCNNFEAIISDLAREQMLDARERTLALSHVDECEACACLLADERALSRGLRSLAASMEDVQAPASVEANLLAKFRERKEATHAPVVLEMPQRVWRWQAYVPQAVAAAVVLMFAIGGASFISRRQGQAPATKPQIVASRQSEPRDATPVGTAATAPEENVKEPDVAEIPTEEVKGRERGQKLSASEVAILVNGTSQPRRPAYQNVPKNRINESGMTQPAASEIATDFMPVSYGDNLNEIDNGRIVRIEMPRSALAQFGLPVNMDRANERIKADVLIGDDGMARAIRFVK